MKLIKLIKFTFHEIYNINEIKCRYENDEVHIIKDIHEIYKI